MPLTYVSGDPLLTQAQYLAFGHNARGRSELGDVEAALMQRYPAPFSTYIRQCRRKRITAGSLWTWTESTPRLMFLPVRKSSVGATRLRYVQSVLLQLARDHYLMGIQSLALVRLGNEYEWGEIKGLVDQWLGNISIPVIVYEEYSPGQPVDERLTG